MSNTELKARIRCTSDTRDRLRAAKTGTERYEDVMQRLLDAYEEDA